MNRMHTSARTATVEEVEQVLRQSDRLRSQSRRGPLAELASDILLVFEMIRDYWKGEYTQVPREVVFWGGAVLAYILCPFDLVPDFVPLVGLLDDAAVFAAFMNSVRGALDDYRVWRAARAAA